MIVCAVGSQSPRGKDLRKVSVGRSVVLNVEKLRDEVTMPEKDRYVSGRIHLEILILLVLSHGNVTSYNSHVFC